MITLLLLSFYSIGPDDKPPDISMDFEDYDPPSTFKRWFEYGKCGSSFKRIPLKHPKSDAKCENCGELIISVLNQGLDPKSFRQPIDSLNERWFELKMKPDRKRNSEPVCRSGVVIAELGCQLKQANWIF